MAVLSTLPISEVMEEGEFLRLPIDLHLGTVLSQFSISIKLFGYMVEQTPPVFNLRIFTHQILEICGNMIQEIGLGFLDQTKPTRLEIMVPKELRQPAMFLELDKMDVVGLRQVQFGFLEAKEEPKLTQLVIEIFHSLHRVFE